MFTEFPKMARLNRRCTITEKIDGSNAQVEILNSATDPIPLGYEVLAVGTRITPDGKAIEYMSAGSRTRYVTPGKETDNYGFAAWVQANADALWSLGPGRHYGEWWGKGINRNYGVPDKRFSLFNVSRWHAVGAQPFETWPNNPTLAPTLSEAAPACCGVVPVLYTGLFHTQEIRNVLEGLALYGSAAAPGFMKPEGVVVYHEAARSMFKVTLEGDAMPKSRYTPPAAATEVQA